jgi:hypothetical protein
LAEAIRSRAANAGPQPGDPNKSLSSYLEELQPRGKGPELPKDFGDFTPEDVLPVIVANDPAPVVEDLKAKLKQSKAAVDFARQAAEDGFRGMDGLLRDIELK